MNEADLQSKSQPVPALVDLGNLIGDYPRQDQALKRWLPLVLGIIAMLASIGLTLMLAIQTWDRINIHGRAVVLSIFPLPFALYAGMFLLGVLLVSLAIVFWQDQIRLFEHGLVMQKAKQTHTWIFSNTDRFDCNISQITFGGSIVSLRVKIILEAASTQQLIIRNRYANITEMVDRLRALILPGLISKNRQRLLQNETLIFHKHLQANQQQITIKSNEYPLNAITFTPENQVIIFHPKENPQQVLIRIKILQLRNLDVLLDLLENPLVIA